METKQCFRCGKTKPTSEFNKNVDSKDGLQSYCRDCQKEYNRSNKKQTKLYREPNKGLLKCSRCGKLKPISEFYRDTKFGYAYRCISCDREYQKERAEKTKANKLNDITDEELFAMLKARGYKGNFSKTITVTI